MIFLAPRLVTISGLYVGMGCAGQKIGDIYALVKAMVSERGEAWIEVLETMEWVKGRFESVMPNSRWLCMILALILAVNTFAFYYMKDEDDLAVLPASGLPMPPSDNDGRPPLSPRGVNESLVMRSSIMKQQQQQ